MSIIKKIAAIELYSAVSLLVGIIVEHKLNLIAKLLGHLQ